MAHQSISKAEALQLLTAVVDGEVSPAKEGAFLECIKHYPDVRREYESLKRIKHLIATRCPKKKAPSSLHHRIDALITDFPSQESYQDRLN